SASGDSGNASTTVTFSSGTRRARARARVAPARPPPAMIRSVSTRSVVTESVRHQSFNIGNGLRHAFGQVSATLFGDHHIVFNTDTNTPPPWLYVGIVGSDIQPGLNGQRHPRFQYPPGIADLVIT